MRKNIMLIIGLISLVIGLLLVNTRVAKIKAGIVTTATVVRIEKRKKSDHWAYRPVLRFINYQNTPMIFKPDGWSDNNWDVGETIKLHYTKDSYDNVSMLTYWKTFGVALHFCCIALILLLMSAGEYLAARFFKTLNYPQPLT